MERIKGTRIGFNNFDILSVNEVIGLNKRIIKDEHDNQIKIFNEFKLELVLAPKKRKEIIIPRPDYDIGYALHRLDKKINFTPFVKDGNMFFKIIDTNNYIVKNIRVYFDRYYTWKDGKDLILKQIKDENNECKFYVDVNNDFINSLRFHKIKYDDYITYYD